MHRTLDAGRRRARTAAGVVLATLWLAVADGADGGGAGPGANPGPAPDLALPARQLAGTALAWYRRTPPADRVTWGGLVACAGLGVGVLLERMIQLRRKRIVPNDFVTRYL